MLTKFMGWCRMVSKTFKQLEMHDGLRLSRGSNRSTDPKSVGASTVTEDNDNDQDGDDEDDENDENDHPRCDWKIIDAIPVGWLEDLVARVATFSGPKKPAKRLAYQKGTYNAASSVGVLTGSKCEIFIVRVPGHATIQHWTVKDKYMMEREVEIIEYIGLNTSAPVPQVCTYSADFANSLHRPFIVMTRLPGKSAYSTWFDEDCDDEDSDTSFRFGDLPSTAVEKKRVNFLRSLAGIMAQINTLSFDQIGMPIIPLGDQSPPTVGPLYQWDNSGSDDFTERPAFSSTQEYLSARPRMFSKLDAVEPGNKVHNYILGARKLLDMIFSQPVFNPSSSITETFTLHHADLDLQNILVDGDGNVTGIIDWDRCLAVPRCVGASSAPLFLQKDWMPEYLNNLETSPHMAFTTHRYRQIYAAALTEHGCPDVQYTTKSAMYQAGVMALYDRDHGDVRDFLRKVLHCIPEFRSDTDEVIQAFGKGWPAGEHIVRQHLAKIFEPEMPDLQILKDVDAEIAAMDWMIDFGDMED